MHDLSLFSEAEHEQVVRAVERLPIKGIAGQNSKAQHHRGKLRPRLEVSAIGC